MGRKRDHDGFSGGRKQIRNRGSLVLGFHFFFKPGPVRQVFFKKTIYTNETINKKITQHLCVFFYQVFDELIDEVNVGDLDK